MGSQRILVTGASGFIGSRLVPFLRSQGHSVNGAHLDLLDFASIESAVRNEPLDCLIHLAAISHVPTCEKNPSLAYQTNLAGTAQLIEVLKRHQPQCHVLFASTAQVYAAPHGAEITQGVVFDENRAIAPQNHYANTKWLAELLVKDAAERYGLKTTVLRLFNHTHRAQSPDFFLPHLYSVLSSAGAGDHSAISVGNLKLFRDIGSIGDLLEAFSHTIENLESFKPFEVFNVCSGKAKSLSILAEGLARLMNITPEFKIDPARVRPHEPINLCGSHRKLTEATGWRPTCHSEEELLRQFLA